MVKRRRKRMKCSRLKKWPATKSDRAFGQRMTHLVTDNVSANANVNGFHLNWHQHRSDYFDMRSVYFFGALAEVYAAMMHYISGLNNPTKIKSNNQTRAICDSNQLRAVLCALTFEICRCIRINAQITSRP